MKRLSRFGVILLGCILIFSSLAPAFADNEPDVNIGEVPEWLSFDQQAVYYIWLTMRMWGIDVTVSDVEGYTQEVNDWLLGQIFEYLDSVPSIGGYAKWIYPWTWDYDIWGNFQGNASFLEDCQDFVDWLLTKLGLEDNETVTTTSASSLDGYSVYETEKWYAGASYSNGYYDGVFGFQCDVRWHELDNHGPGHCYYMYYKEPLSDYLWLVVFSSTNYAYTMWLNYDDGSGLVWHYWDDFPQYYTAGLWYVSSPKSGATTSIRPNGNYFVGGFDQLLYLIEHGTIVSGEATISTGDIILPADDPDYTPGDSIVIYIDDSIGYIDINWPDSISVNNLPAVVSTGTVQNPGLEEAYSPILALINYSGDAMAAIIGIMYELPEEVIVPVYAVMGAVIVFGVIKLMREH